MGYTPLVRWRNFTLDNLKSILNVFPDMTRDITRDFAVSEIETEINGYRRTAYQFACQLGLECREEGYLIQNYLLTFDDENLNKYLDFWFKMYVCPNPYINSNENPISIFYEIANEILGSENLQISYVEFCKNNFGDGKSNDILKNAIKNYAKPIQCRDDILFLNKDDIDELKKLIDKVEKNLPKNNDMTERDFFNRFSYDQFCDFFDISTEFSIAFENNDYLSSKCETDRVKNGSNILLYGVPGVGKSHIIETYYCKNSKLMERVVFHPDYMNTDFVGQILPVVKGEGDEKEITYDFIAGPFTRILKKAINNPSKHYYLIIEEINRGNAPAIFGEIFQLLDREPSGTSVYKINNYNIASIVYGNSETPIFIPSNLSILATMNTADQNVFTLDTAFQRRWNMKMIENDVSTCKYSKNKILDTTVSWEIFNNTINEQITTIGSVTLSSEDKRLGAYFISEEDLKFYSKELDKDLLLDKYDIEPSDDEALDRIIKDLNYRFGDKVIKYLWDDVFKFSRSDLFEEKYKTLENVLKDFNKYSGDNKYNIFKSEIKVSLLQSNVVGE